MRHGTGIVCVSMKEDDLERLQLPLMVTAKENEDKLRTAFTVSVDAKEGTQQQGFQLRIGQTQFLHLHLQILSLRTLTGQDIFFLLNIEKVVCSKGLGILKHQ